jgi:hypothetical protein
MHIHFVDIQTTLLNDELQGDNYMGHPKERDDATPRVTGLLHSIYVMFIISLLQYMYVYNSMNIMYKYELTGYMYTC